MIGAQDILKFWYEEIEPKQHWVKDPQFDQLIKSRFGETHQAAHFGECFHWRETPEGRLAEIIVLDQFSRNMYRDTPQAFASDNVALILAQELVSSGDIKKLPKEKRGFGIMPYMHSESLAVHDFALKLFADPEMGGSLEYEEKHRDIIVRFGRYPHRNKILGRESTPEEIEFLQGPGSSF